MVAISETGSREATAMVRTVTGRLRNVIPVASRKVPSSQATQGKRADDLLSPVHFLSVLSNKPFFNTFGFISRKLFFKIAIQNIMARKRQFP